MFSTVESQIYLYFLLLMKYETTSFYQNHIYDLYGAKHDAWWLTVPAVPRKEARLFQKRAGLSYL